MKKYNYIFPLLLVAFWMQQVNADTENETHLINDTYLGEYGGNATLQQSLSHTGALTLTAQDIGTGMNLDATLYDPSDNYLDSEYNWHTTPISVSQVWSGGYELYVENTSGYDGTFDAYWNLAYQVNHPPNPVTVSVGDGTMSADEDSITITVSFTNPSDPDTEDSDYIEDVLYYCNGLLADAHNNLSSDDDEDTLVLYRTNSTVNVESNSIYVVVADTQSGTTTSSTIPFTVDEEAADQATYLSPSDGANDVAKTASLSWTAGTGTAQHKVYFGTSDSPPCAATITTASTTTWDPPGDMTAGAHYYWGIGEVNSEDYETTPQDFWDFWVLADPVSTPSPSDGKIDVFDTTSSLAWNTSAGAASYEVYFGEESAGMSSIGTTSSTSIGIGSLTAGARYLWTVKSVNGGEGETSGSPWEFYVKAHRTTGPFPADNADGVSSSVTLSWSNAAGAANYNVYFGTSQANMQLEQTGSGCNYNPSGTLIANQQYFWRVDSINSAGAITEGHEWGFTVGAAPVITSPSSVSATVSSVFSYLIEADNNPSYFGASLPDWLHRSGSNIYGTPDPGDEGETSFSVSATNACGTSYLNVSLTVYEAPPQQAAIVSPGNGEADVPINLTLEWSPVSDADYYYVYISTNQNPRTGEDMILVPVEAPGTSCKLPIDLEINQSYYWVVDTKNTNPNTTLGVPREFTTTLNPFPTDDPNGLIPQSTKVQLSWGSDFTPADDSNLFGWWDPLDRQNMRTENGIIRDWTARFGRGTFSAYKSSGPEINSRTENGFVVPNFVRANEDAMIAKAYSMGNTATYACVVVADSETDSADGVISYIGNDWNNSYWNINKTSWDIYGAVSSDLASTVHSQEIIFDGLAHIVIVEVEEEGSITLYVDGKNAGSQLITGDLYDTAMLGMMIGQYLPWSADGAMMDYIVTGSTDTTNRQNIEGYLARKWGLLANLPVTHPYKTTTNSYDIYFGMDEVDVANATTSTQGIYKGNYSVCEYIPPETLDYNTAYYWRVDTIEASGTTTGAVWSFTTDPLPIAMSPDPSNEATEASRLLELNWNYNPAIDENILGWWDPLDEKNLNTTNGIIQSWTAREGTGTFTPCYSSGPTMDGSITVYGSDVTIPNFEEDPSDDGMVSVGYTLGNSATFACVAYVDSNDQQFDGIFSIFDSSYNNYWCLTQGGNDPWGNYMAEGILGSDMVDESFWATIPVFDGQAHVIVVEAVSGSRMTLYVDGKESGSASFSGSLPSTATLGMMIGRYMPHSSGGGMMDYIVTGSTDTGNRQKLEGYLARKWDLMDNLPGGHPYKDTAISYNVYFGTEESAVENATTNDPEFVGNYVRNSFVPEFLDNLTTYYWRIDTVSATRSSKGPVWSFMTEYEMDSDNDGLLDDWEIELFDTLIKSGSGDADSDGLTNFEEFQERTMPLSSDTDQDGVADGSDADPLRSQLEIYRPFP